MNTRVDEVIIEVSPSVYMTLLGLVRDAQLIDGDAGHLLKMAERELIAANAGGMISSELAEVPERITALRRAGVIGR